MNSPFKAKFGFRKVETNDTRGRLFEIQPAELVNINYIYELGVAMFQNYNSSSLNETEAQESSAT